MRVEVPDKVYFLRTLIWKLSNNFSSFLYHFAPYWTLIWKLRASE
ncbi:hypothetical protein [Stygiolobus caldivivus]|nr:hypothetical protein [Stygiolobus caldivivus]